MYVCSAMMYVCHDVCMSVIYYVFVILPCSGPGERSMKVTEVMGESQFSFTIPMQLL